MLLFFLSDEITNSLSSVFVQRFNPATEFCSASSLLKPDMDVKAQLTSSILLSADDVMVMA